MGVAIQKFGGGQIACFCHREVPFFTSNNVVWETLRQYYHLVPKGAMFGSNPNQPAEQNGDSALKSYSECTI